MLRVDDLTVRYGPVTAADRVTLELHGNETLALLGRSGSGKTTVLRAIAGLAPIVEGSITLDGADLRAIPAHRRDIGLVFQDFALFPHLDVAENVAYGLRMRGHRDIEDRVQDALTMVGLAGLGGRRIDQLSGGQAQRVALARTLAPRPRLLLLDEPLGSLDPDLRSSLAADLQMLIEATGVPTIIVTHDTEEAFAIGSRVAILVDGRVVAAGTPAEVWARPPTAAVARLLGHTGIISATVTDGAAAIGGSLVPVSAADGPATLLIPGGTTAIGGPINAEVVSSRYRGPDWVTTVSVPGGTLEVATPERHATGESIDMAVDPARVVLLG